MAACYRGDCVTKLKILLSFAAFMMIYYLLLKFAKLNEENHRRDCERFRVQQSKSTSMEDFYHRLSSYYDTMEKLQVKIDTIMKSRERVIGNIAWFPTQVLYYAREVNQDWIHNICEIGYGAGHSALLFLFINQQAHLYSFDIFPLPSNRQNIGQQQQQKDFQSDTLLFIKNTPEFTRRFHQVVGDSNETIPAFVKRNPELRCDFISIDGSHIPPQPFFDILNLKPLAHNRTITVLDDMHPPLMRDELNKAIKSKILTEYECLIPEFHTDKRFASSVTTFKKFCSARYIL